MGKAKEPVQMKLPFARPYSDIQMRETIRGIKAITRELVRFGVDKKDIADLMETIGETKELVLEAIEQMDEKLLAQDD